VKEPRFFRSAAAFGRWLAGNHGKRSELLVGLYKKHAAHRGMTYPEAVDEALCWGWIDGVMRRLDEDAIAQRFTPRKAKSTWSLVNCRKVEALIAAGRMRAPGLAAYEARDPARTGIYSFERERAVFTPAQLKAFKRSAPGWKWFRGQAESYQAAATFWVVSAKQEATRSRRLHQLIEQSAAGEKLPRFMPLHQRSK
jgi:uncharacterized protein YdeI (YjbR/CyaY-like superfamily)